MDCPYVADCTSTPCCFHLILWPFDPAGIASGPEVAKSNFRIQRSKIPIAKMPKCTNNRCSLTFARVKATKWTQLSTVSHKRRAEPSLHYHLLILGPAIRPTGSYGGGAAAFNNRRIHSLDQSKRSPPNLRRVSFGPRSFNIDCCTTA